MDGPCTDCQDCNPDEMFAFECPRCGDYRCPRAGHHGNPCNHDREGN